MFCMKNQGSSHFSYLGERQKKEREKKMKITENVDTCLLILPGTFIWPTNVSPFSGSISGFSLNHLCAVTPIQKEVINSFRRGVSVHRMGQKNPLTAAER